MELRGQDKEIGIPSSSSYNPNRDSSSKVPPPHHRHHQQQQHHQSHKHPREPNLTPDPAPAHPAAVVTTTTTRSRSISRSPPPISTAMNTAPTPSSSSSSATYKECLRNHAASTGGHVLDGCGEFMPGGEEGTPEALKCAACECHRSFHRKEIDGESLYVANSYYHRNNGQRNTILPPPQQLATSLPPPHPPLNQYHRYHHTAPIAPMMMTFGGGSGGAAAESSSEDLDMFQSNLQGQTSVQPLSKKRFRTKFSQEQKDQMTEFAEKLGWKIQKQDEQEVQQFCSQVGVKRKVFKVWMHNNKQSMKKKQK